jgi:excisionase family DNA binding protein
MARIFDVIEVTDQQQNEMVRRFPETGAGDYRIGSQVIVRESQSAVFFRDGKALDIFGAGRHTITTANIPYVINLIGKAFNERSPFTAEVYFINLREFIDMKWGTAEPIALRDPDLGMARIRAYGTYSMQVSDPQLFVTKVVGTRSIYRSDDIEGFLRGMILSRLTDLLAETKASLFDLPALFDEFSSGVRAKLTDDFDGLGLKLKTFFINTVSPTEETQKAIDERASMGAIGDMNKYMQFKAARAMGDLAQKEGTGGASDLTGAGLGLGAGVGLGGMFSQMMGQAMRGGEQPQAPAAGAGAAANGTADVLTLSEAAQYMKAGEEDVLEAIKSGGLKAKKIGSSYRLSKKAIDDFLNS